MNYISLIPFLIAGEQELDSTLLQICHNLGTQNGTWNDTGKIEWGTNPLLHNTTLPMVNSTGGSGKEWSIYYTGQSSMANSSNPVDIGVGYYDTTALLGAKIDVKDSTIQSLQTQLTALQNCCNQQNNQSDGARHNNGGNSGGNGNNGNGGTDDDRIGNPISSHDLVLSSSDAILYQNYPDPFTGSTKIRYFIPQTVVAANIIFFDEFGNTIANYVVSERGNMGELNIDATTLAAGTYSYSMVLDNVVNSSKRMVHTK